MKREKERGRGMFIFICVIVFFCSIAVGVYSKVKIQPAWVKKYEVKWSLKLDRKSVV